MKVYILFDHTRDEITLFRSKRGLIQKYILDLKKDYNEHFNDVLNKLKNNETSLDDDSKTELIRAFEGNPYDVNLIDLFEYFQSHDCETECIERFLFN